MTARYVKPGEMLAIHPGALVRSDVGAFFWMVADPPRANERIGDVAIVSIRGELEHHKSEKGAESYEGILERLNAAVTGEDCAVTAEGETEPTLTPPKTILACIDSPGGVVAGLNECVRSIQKLVKAHPDIEFACYVNEMAASAAYAIACAFPEIIAPPDSAVLGSIGVISTMISQAKKNEKDGYDVVLLTSGARKADGHVHAPISDKAQEVEMGRVNTLAAAFFSLASKARGIPVDRIEGFQAGIFLSKAAKARGLADAIMSWDDVILGASKEKTPTDAFSGGNKTDRRVGVRSDPGGSKQTSETHMPIALNALIKKTEAKIAAEKDPAKLTRLYASLDAYKKTEKHIEHTKSEEDDDPDDEDDDDDDEDGDKKKKGDESEEEEKKSKHSEEEKKSKHSEEEEKASKGDDEEEEAKATLALVRRITGMKGEKARGAIEALASLAANTAKDVAEMKLRNAQTEKSAMIASAKGKFITAKEADFLAGQSASTATGFIEMRRKAGGIVVTDEGDLVKPQHQGQPGTEASLPKDTIAMIDQAVAAFPGDREAFRATLVKNHLAAHAKAAMNEGVH